MNKQELLDSFYENGFVHLPAMFEAEKMDELDRIILEHFGHAPNLTHEKNFLDKAAVEVVPWFPQREGNKDFDSLEENSLLNDLSKDILGEAWETQYCMIMFSKAGTVGQAWHQDCPPDDAKQFNLNRLVYTSDIVDEIGGQVVVMPGSHKRGELTIGDPHEDFTDQLVLKPKKGDMILLHGHCWHRIMPIKSGYRSSVNFRAAPAGVPEDITDICVYRNMRYQFSTSSVVEERLSA